MRSEGKFFGRNVRPIKVVKQLVSSATSEQVLDLSALPTRQNGHRLAVLGFLMVLPLAAWSQAANKQADGATLAQLIQSMTIEYARDSAPHKAIGRQQLCSNLDGHTLFNLLSYRSGMACFPGVGSNHFTSVGTAATEAGGPSKIANALYATGGGVRVSGDWLHFLGPFVSSDADGVSVSERISAFVPFTRKGHDDSAFPPEWFSGGGGCAADGSAGAIRFTLGSTVDGQSVTWTTSGDDGHVEVYAIVMECGEKQPAGLPLVIETDTPLNGVHKVGAGAIEFLGFAKELSSGAMVANGYTEVEVTLDGDALILPKSSEHLRFMNMLNAHGDGGFGFAIADTTIATAAQATRRANWCYPLLVERAGDSIIRAAGSDRERCLEVKIVTTSETTHRLVTMRSVPFEDAARRAAIAAAQSGCKAGAPVEIEPNARNGNTVISPALAKLLPQVIKTAAMVEPK